MRKVSVLPRNGCPSCSGFTVRFTPERVSVLKRIHCPFCRGMGVRFQRIVHVGVNRQLLWEEYCQDTTNPYSYAQFCHHLQQYKKGSRPSMHLEHHPGEKLYIDFAGKRLSYVDRETGEVIPVQVFVACLPYSDYCFA